MTWKTKTLTELCKMYQPKTLSKKQLKSDGKYLVYGANGIIGKHDKYNHEKSQLLITCRGATCGSINISEPFSWINGNAMVIQPNENENSKKFLEYLFKGPINFLKITTGSAQPQITRESLNPILVSYPSLSEQEETVTKLDEVFAEIDNKINLLKQKSVNISCLLNAFIKKKFFVKNQLYLSLEDVSDIINGYAFKSQDFSNDNTGIKSIKITNVGLNKFEENDKDYLPKKFSEKYSMFKAENNDLVFALTRSIIKGGLKLAKVPKNYHGALLNQRVAIIKAKKDKILLDYLYFYLHSDIVKKYVINNVNTLMQPNLSISDLKLLPVPMESLKNQKLIIENLNIVNTLIIELKRNLIKKTSNLLQLKSSIIKKYLNNKAA